MHNIYSRWGDAILWTCLGAIGTLAIAHANKHLQAVREVARITKEEKQEEIISQKTEDAVKLETLGELLKSPIYEIRQAAVKLIVERVGRNGNYELLLKRIRSRSPDVQAEALASLRFLLTCSTHDALSSTLTVSALISFLASRLPLVAKRPFTPTEYLSRPQSECDALICLLRLLHCQLPQALSLGLISRWLAHYPFGGPGIKQAEKQDAFLNLALRKTDDQLLCEVVRLVVYSSYAREEMRRVGILGGQFAEVLDIEFRTGDIDGADSIVNTHLNAESRPGTPPPPVSQEFERVETEAWQVIMGNNRNAVEGQHTMRQLMQELERFDRDFPPPNGFLGGETSAMITSGTNRNTAGLSVAPRLRDENPEEVALRRRRRMAMVVSDGGPLGRDNIYDGPSDNWRDGFDDVYETGDGLD